jgi:ribosome biogenesis GTPase
VTGPRRYDESDVRVRPNPRGSRPRTKDRPEHADAVPGRVLTIDRGRFTALVAADTPDERTVVAMKARELARSGAGSIAVGDRVDLVGDTSGGVDALARVVRVQARRTALRRSADDTDPVERVLVANADQLLVVTSTVDPEPNLRLVDRCLAAAWDAGMDAVIALTKADLGDPARALAAWAALDVPVLVLARRTAGGARSVEGLDAVRAGLAGRDTVLVGPSGVGKSTLVNALVPTALRAVGGVNAVTGQGRHTSSSAVALRLPAAPGGPAAAGGASGWVTDTPGVRSFGLAHLDPQRLLTAFGDLAGGSAECPRGCSHDEVACALDAWVASGAAGDAGAARLESLRRLLRSRAGEEAGGRTVDEHG